ncbi:DUF4386 family protein [Paenibacillus alginolyticus]|uniref:DUF4386 family protein n=1 Tax=Paenibacillus alginolyticus TaxID=59839 RepID=UPI001FE59A6C|nr:DUF4386 family protein [Paenibacillus frigoriresistens]
MNANIKSALLVGVLFILAAVTAIIGLLLYDPILNGPDYLMKGSEHANQVILGALMELMLVRGNACFYVCLVSHVRCHSTSFFLGCYLGAASSS